MKKRKLEINCYHGKSGISGNAVLCALAAICVILAVLCGFVLPGVRFSAFLFTALAALCGGYLLLNAWAGTSRAGRIVRNAVTVCLAALLLLFVAVEGMILHAGHAGAMQEPDAVIVLGAGVNGKSPSLVLRSRINAAADYLKQWPDAPAILSGGRGTGEDVTEAQAMYDGLVELGIDPDRLILEEQSTTTAENFQNSTALLKEHGVDPSSAAIAVVTSDFHLYRALHIAQSAGIRNAGGVPARVSWWWLSANYDVREFFALGKMVLCG